MSESMAVLVQTAPHGPDIPAAVRDIESLPDVAEAGCLHVLTLTDERIVGAIHVTPADEVNPLKLSALVAARLRSNHEIRHVAVQMNRPGCIGVADH